MIPSEYEKMLNITEQAIKFFRISNIKEDKFNIGFYFSDEKINPVHIMFKTNGTQFYSFGKDRKDKEVINLGNKCKTERDVAVAIKNMDIVISDDEKIINIAEQMKVKTFAILEKEKTFDNKCITLLCVKTTHERNRVFVKLKETISDLLIEKKEKNLLNCLKTVKEDKTRPPENIAETQLFFLSKLFDETFKTKYLEEAIQIQKEYSKFHPYTPEILAQIATIYGFYLGEKEKSEKIWQKALPNLENPALLFNYACFEFSNGNFEKFYKYYWQTKFIEAKSHFRQKMWYGEENVSDKTIFVQFEQGYGDTILFSRYLNDIKNLFKEITVSVPPKIIELLQENFPEIKFILPNKKIYSTDYYTYLTALPAILKKYPADYKKKKWLKANKEKVREFKKYFDKNKFNIGIFWDSTKGHLVRNTTLETFIPLAYIDNVKLYSLNVNKEDFEVNYIDDSVEIVNLGRYFHSFSDTAAAIENCDLIIATDSSVLNLAGAMGKKTFGIFNKINEFRWFKLDGEDTGWYKTVKPFQAKKQNDFKPVMEKICKEVVKEIQKSGRFSGE